MKTYGVHYLGSKAKILPHILHLTNKTIPKGSKVLDIFTGSGRVAQALKQDGFIVYTGDLNDASRVYSNALVHTKDFQHLQ